MNATLTAGVAQLCTFSRTPFAQQQLLGAGGEEADSTARHGTARGGPVAAGPRTAERSQPQHMKTDTGFTIEERAARNRGHHAALGVPALPRTEAPSRPAQECGLSRCCTERTLRPPPLTAPVGAAGSAPRGWEPTACPPQSTTTRCASARTPPRQRPGVPSTPQVPIARSQRRRGAGTAIGPSTAAPTGRDGTAASRAETDLEPRPRAPAPAAPCGPPLPPKRSPRRGRPPADIAAPGRPGPAPPRSARRGAALRPSRPTQEPRPALRP